MKRLTVLFLALGCSLALFAQKKPLSHDVYDGWNSIRSMQFSKDGKFIVYALTPQEGDATLVIHNTKTGKNTEIERGERPKIDEDNSTVFFYIKPHLDTLKSMRRAGKKKKELPKDTLGVYSLSTEQLSKIPHIKSFQFPDKAGKFLAYQVEPQKEKKPKKEEEEPKEDKEKEEKKDKKPAKKQSSKNGYHLIVRNLESNAEDTIEYVMSYQINEDGSYISYYTSGSNTSKEGVHIYNPSTTSDQTIYPMKSTVKGFKWDESNEQLTYLVDNDTTKGHDKDPIKYYDLQYWKAGSPMPTTVAKSQNKAFNGQYISSNAKPRFSKDGTRILFGTATIPLVQDTSLLDEEIINVEVWHWKDEYLYPQQNANLNRTKNKTYTAVASLTDGTLTQLGSPELDNISIPDDENADYAIGMTNLPYGQFISWEGFPYYHDVYKIDIKSGKKELLMTKAHGYPEVSPSGKYLYWYSNKDTSWVTYEFTSSKITYLNKDSKFRIWQELHDYPNHPYSYGMAGWTEDDASLLLYDRYDILEFHPTKAQPTKNLTSNGRTQGIEYRYVKLDPEEEFIDLKSDLLLTAFRQSDKAEGYFSLSPKSGKAPKQLIMEDYAFSYPIKAEDSDLIYFNKRSFQKYPDYYLTNTKFKNPKQITDANPQMKDYLWGTVELTSWTNNNGETMEGLIYKPENFDPNKKYPMMVYFYERYADRLHAHYAPAPIRSIINFSYFTSNDYVIFVPDIKYDPGFPGKSAEDCLIPGVLSMIEKGYVNKDRIGIQGHSWGGYQIAHLVTKTNLFRCAEAGAPVSNMTSAYGGIRWASGLSRMFQYEHTQSRIGGTLWEKPSHYIENSPLFRADKIETPLLMMHNDEDGAVPWYQGIELFVAMRRLGKPVWMLNYNGEAHGLQKRQNKRDFAIRLYQFFDYYLKDEPMPEWMENGVPAVEKGINTGLDYLDKE